jgi:hypothetical protein
VPEFLILKLEGDDPRNAQIVSYVTYEGEDPAEALAQGYAGDGRYALLSWSERVEGDLVPGPVEVAAVEDAAARTETAEAAETAAQAAKEE